MYICVCVSIITTLYTHLLFYYITDMELNSSCEEEVDDVDSATPLNVVNKIVGGRIPEKMDPSK